jgi:hypothetical protein
MHIRLWLSCLQSGAPFTGSFRPVQKLEFLADGQGTGTAMYCNAMCPRDRSLPFEWLAWVTAELPKLQAG